MHIPALLAFEEKYMPRIWGGDKLRSYYGKDTPQDEVIGESWLVSDHSSHESVISSGPLQGETLRELLAANAAAVLGSDAALTIHGRFPLLLKLIDAAQTLSVQVHPDDAAAQRLGEPDVGKTEMWHVLDADPGSELICGLKPGVTKEAIEKATKAGGLEDLLQRFDVKHGTVVFVPAGAVHAIGGGLLLAEIQQNSDITYRLYDWGRVDTSGKPRELHLDKALEVIDFDSSHQGASMPLDYHCNGGLCRVLSACRYFAAELWMMNGSMTRQTYGSSFHILLGVTGRHSISANGTEMLLAPGCAMLVAGSVQEFRISGEGEVLDYYVPNLDRDVFKPLADAGHTEDVVSRLVYQG